MPTPTSVSVLLGSSRTRLGKVVPNFMTDVGDIFFSALTKFTTSPTVVVRKKRLSRREPSGQRIYSVEIVLGSALAGGSAGTTRLAISASL